MHWLMSVVNVDSLTLISRALFTSFLINYRHDQTLLKETSKPDVYLYTFAEIGYSDECFE